jgi:hypothetical protein
MKTRILYRLAVVTIVTATIFAACKKSDVKTSDNGTTSTDLQTQSDDQTRVSNETDAVANDVNTMLSSQATVSGASASPGYRSGVAVEGGGIDTVKSYICDAVVTIDTSTSTRKITITYNGNNCAVTRTRSGVVVISIPAGVHWKDKGAVITVDIQKVKITRLIDSKSITLNGTHTYTNVTGGSLTNLADVAKGITHTITSDNMSVTFDDNSLRTWHVARQRSYALVNGGGTITTSGTHADGNTTGISEWGTNRFGNSFETVITTPLVLSSACSSRLISGAVSVIRPEVTTAVTFGLDASGNAVSSCPTGSYYFKVVWTAGGKSYTFILPY